MRTFVGATLLLGCIGVTGCGGSAATNRHVTSSGRQTILVLGAHSILGASGKGPPGGNRVSGRSKIRKMRTEATTAHELANPHPD
jgi:hypothetical protein